MLFRQHLGRLVAQKLQVLAQYSPRESGVDDVVHEPTPSDHLSRKRTKHTRERGARAMRDGRTCGSMRRGGQVAGGRVCSDP